METDEKYDFASQSHTNKLCNNNLALDFDTNLNNSGQIDYIQIQKKTSFSWQWIR